VPEASSYTLGLGPLQDESGSCGRKPLRQEEEEERMEINGMPPKLRLVASYACGESQVSREGDRAIL
jgi:hypothetical protein